MMEIVFIGYERPFQSFLFEIRCDILHRFQYRQIDPYPVSAPAILVNNHFPSEGLNDLVCQIKAYAGPILFLGKKLTEDKLKILFGYPLSEILMLNLDLIAL